jgi:hypothetical protein
MTHKYFYATSMGSLYRLRPVNWIRYLQARAKGYVNLDDYGECVQNSIPNVTDWDEGRAQFELSDIAVRES